MVKGLDKLRNELRKVPALVQAEVAQEMERIATLIVADMKRLAPLLQKPDRRRRRGALKDSIGWTWGEPPEGSMRIGKVAPRRDGFGITIYAGTRNKRAGVDDAFYARWMEFGTKEVTAQPFFWPAYRAHRPKIAPALRRAVKRVTVKV